MAIPNSKTELIQAIQTRFEKLDAALDDVPPELSAEKTMSGHAKDTMMSVNNLLAYLIGWNALVLKWLAQDANHQAIDFPETGFKWNQLGDLAQKFYQDYSAQHFAENRTHLEALKTQLIQEIEKRSDDELYGAPWYRTWTKGRMIQLNSSSPYENARLRIRKWLKE